MEALTGKDAADGDAVLFDRLILSEFTGPLYERVADRLASYGYQVLAPGYAAARSTACAPRSASGAYRPPTAGLDGQTTTSTTSSTTPWRTR